MKSKGIILAVDDDHESLSLLVKILTPKGYQINLADSGAATLITVYDNPPDLILLDINMKDMDGIEVCRQLKENENTRHIPIIFISSHSEMKHKLEGLKKGAVDYITKPFQLEELLMRVSIHMALSLANTSIKNQDLTLKNINKQLQDEIAKRQQFENELQINLDHTEHSRLALVSALEYQKKIEETVRDSELRYRRLFEAARDGILILNFDSGMVVDVNPFLVELLGYEREEFLDKKIWEIGFFCDIIENKENFAELKQNEYIRYENMALKTKDGRRIEVEFISNVYLVNHSKVIQCNIRDNSNKKRTELYQKIELDIINILNESNDMPDSIQRILSVLKSQTGFDAVGFRLKDGDDYPYIAQQGFSVDVLSKENSLIKRSSNDKMCRDKDGSIILECTCGMVISNKVDSTNPFLTRGGSFWTNDSFPLLDLSADQEPRINPRNECIHQGYRSMALIPIRTNNNNIGLLHIIDRRKGCFTIDIIEHLEKVATYFGNALTRKQAEDALRESEEHYRVLFQSSSDGILITDSETRTFKYVNPAMCRMLGYTDEEMKKLSVIDIHPKEAIPHILAAIEAQTRGDVVPSQDIPCIRKDGSTFYVNITGTTINIGDRMHSVGFFRDITERKMAEQEQIKLEVQLQQAQKMESVGRLAGGVAHDFNNMLQVILGNAYLAKKEVPADSSIYESLNEIQECAERSADLTQKLLIFARKQVVIPQVINLNDTVESMLKILSRLIGEDINLAWLPGTDLWPVKMDSSQVDQILANLCVNARDAISDIGKITIETENHILDDDYCEGHAGFFPGEYVCISVSDNGSGIDKETLEHIFEPFFTTKAIGKGTGLGLATVYGAVKQNNGFINAYSEPNQGTTFKIYLPRYINEAEQVEIANKEEILIPTGNETILLVEDEPTILKLVQRMLTRLGYMVLAANTAKEAIILAEEHNDKIDLLVSDVIMPDMNGHDLSLRLLEKYSKIKSLFMSGYTADVIARHGVLKEGIHFIQKPFSEKELADKVREALE